MQRPSFTRRVLWALARRCANCGHSPIFQRWFRMEPVCPRCELKFERMPGYWLGAMMLNFGITAAGILLVIVGVAAATWPDPPWRTVWITAMAIGVVVPLLAFPWTRTLFSAMELAVRPPDAE